MDRRPAKGGGDRYRAFELALRELCRRQRDHALANNNLRRDLSVIDLTRNYTAKT